MLQISQGEISPAMTLQKMVQHEEYELKDWSQFVSKEIEEPFEKNWEHLSFGRKS